MKKRFSLFLLNLGLASSFVQAGDLKNRFKDYKNDVEPAEDTLVRKMMQVNQGSLEVLGAGFLGWVEKNRVSIAKESNDFRKLESKGPKFKYLLKNVSVGNLLVAAVFAVDGVGRIYLVSQGKNPTFTPLPGIVASVVSKDGRKDLAEGTKVVLKRSAEKIAEPVGAGVKYVFSEEGLLQDITVFVTPAVKAAQNAIDEVSETVKAPPKEAEEEQNH